MIRPPLPRWVRAGALLGVVFLGVPIVGVLVARLRGDPHAFARVRLLFGNRDGVLMIPEQAIVSGGGEEAQAVSSLYPCASDHSMITLLNTLVS